MAGEPIEALRQGIKALVAELKGDPQALETVWVSLITFGSEAKQGIPLTELASFPEPLIEAGGKRDLGLALELLQACLSREFQISTAAVKGDWVPLVLIFMDGPATDSWQEHAEKLRQCYPCRILVLASISDTDESVFRSCGIEVTKLNNPQPDSLKGFFRWASPDIRKPFTD